MAVRRPDVREIAIDPQGSGAGMGGFRGFIDRRDRGGPGLSVGGLAGLPGVRFGTGSSLFKIRPEPDRRVKVAPVKANTGRAAIPSIVAGEMELGKQFPTRKLNLPWERPPLPALPPEILNPPVIRAPRPKSPLDIINEWIKPEEKDVAGGFDLGNLIGTLGGRYIDAKYGGPPATTRVDDQSWEPPAWLDIPGYDLRNPLRSPFGREDGMGGPPGCNDGYTGCDPYRGMVFNPRANCGKGAWVKRRRRRKRLASASDIKDLTSLLSVFGNGKALQTWIATH